MLCSRGRDLKRYEGESVGTKSFSPPSEQILVFLKRKPRLLHYSNEWKKSPAWQLLLNHENPRDGRPLATGEDLGSSDRRNRMEAAPAIFGVFRPPKLSPYPATSLGTSRQSSFREQTALIHSFWQLADEFRSQIPGGRATSVAGNESWIPTRDAGEDYRKMFQTIKRMVGAVCRANPVRARTPSYAEPTREVSSVTFSREPHIPHPVRWGRGFSRTRFA